MIFLYVLAVATLKVASAHPVSLETRQSWTTSWWGQEFLTYGCQAPIIFVFAKATLEPGNLGNTVGPLMSNGLKTVFGVQNVEAQGVNYWGLPDGNFCPGGAPIWGIRDSTMMAWEEYSFDVEFIVQRTLIAAAACPNSKIVAAGYSQGAALVHRAVEGLGQAVKDKIAGVVTFGDTQAWQDSGRIKGYPPEKTLIICNVGDALCSGTIIVVPIHFDYTKWVPTAIQFLTTTLLNANALDPWPTDMMPSIPDPSSIHTEV